MHPSFDLPARHPDLEILAQETQAHHPSFFRGTMSLPPSINAAYKIVHIGQCERIGPTQKLEDFKEQAAWELKTAYIDEAVLKSIQRSRVKIPLAVILRVYFPTMWKCDLDDVLKFAIDAAFLRCGLNDNQVVHIDADKFADREHPRVEIEIQVK